MMTTSLALMSRPTMRKVLQVSRHSQMPAPSTAAAVSCRSELLRGILLRFWAGRMASGLRAGSCMSSRKALVLPLLEEITSLYSITLGGCRGVTEAVPLLVRYTPGVRASVMSALLTSCSVQTAKISEEGRTPCLRRRRTRSPSEHIANDRR